MTVQFGEYCFDADAREIRRTTKLTPAMSDFFRLLVERPGELVTLDDVKSLGITSRSSFHTYASDLRALVSGSDSEPAVIETVRGRGYRFTAELSSRDPQHRRSGQAAARRPKKACVFVAHDAGDGGGARRLARILAAWGFPVSRGDDLPLDQRVGAIRGASAMLVPVRSEESGAEQALEIGVAFTLGVDMMSVYLPGAQSRDQQPDFIRTLTPRWIRSSSSDDANPEFGEPEVRESGLISTLHNQLVGISARPSLEGIKRLAEEALACDRAPELATPVEQLERDYRFRIRPLRKTVGEATYSMARAGKHRLGDEAATAQFVEFATRAFDKAFAEPFARHVGEARRAGSTDLEVLRAYCLAVFEEKRRLDGSGD